MHNKVENLSHDIELSILAVKNSEIQKFTTFSIVYKAFTSL